MGRIEPMPSNLFRSLDLRPAAVRRKAINDNLTLRQQLQASLALELARQQSGRPVCEPTIDGCGRRLQHHHQREEAMSDGKSLTDVLQDLFAHFDRLIHWLKDVGPNYRERCGGQRIDTSDGKEGIGPIPHRDSLSGFCRPFFHAPRRGGRCDFSAAARHSIVCDTLQLNSANKVLSVGDFPIFPK
jgi:hypothetical protein